MGDPAVVVLDAAHTVMLWNTQAERLLGWSTPEALGRRLEELGVVCSADGRLADLVTGTLVGAGREHSASVRRRDGREVSVHVRADPARGGPDAAGSVVVVFRAADGEFSPEARDFRAEVLRRTAALLDGSTPIEAALEAVARLLVPALADHCVVDIRRDGVLRRMVVVHAEGLPANGPVFLEPGSVVEYPPGHPCATALADGRAVLGRPQPARPAAEPAPAHTRIAVPFRAHGETYGVLTLICSASGRGYDRGDLRLVEEVAGRMALAARDALAGGLRPAIAVGLPQERLTTVPDVDGLRVTTRHRAPCGVTATAFADVVALSAGRLGAVVGEVHGDGPGPVAAMEQIRAAVRAYAALDLPPVLVMANLDVLVRSWRDQTVTCSYGVYDPWCRTARLVDAGQHPPVLLVEGQARALDVPRGVPLGVGGVPYAEHRVTVPGGALMLLATPGLFRGPETPPVPVVRALASLPAAARADAEAVAEAALASAADDGPRGTAVLVLGADRVDLPKACCTFPAIPEAVAQARRFAEDTLLAWGVSEVDTAVLLVSETVTNAVRHAEGTDTVRVWMRRGHATVWVEVFDGNPRLPRLRLTDEGDEGGRGLYLVDMLAPRWGTRATDEGKAVWFALDAPPSNTPGYEPPDPPRTVIPVSAL